MSIVEKVDALMAGMTKADIERLLPAGRQQLAQELRRVADLADPPVRGRPCGAEAAAGVILELARHGRSYE